MKYTMTTTDIFTEKIETEEAISLVKTTFEKQLRKSLNLYRVSAPMIVLKGTGINDDLNGVERAAQFPVKDLKDHPAEVVQSLAKWKRLRLAEYQISPGTGILTDMRALRPDEDFSPIHSIYVDQWDWEVAMDPEQRKISYLKDTVRKIYASIKATESQIAIQYPEKSAVLPDEITFLHSEELLQMFPDKSPKERENLAAKKFGAYFLMGIGGSLSHGEPHDGRAPDYDDWSSPGENGLEGLNGDIIFWNPVLGSAFEISSMGIRVDASTLERQLSLTGKEERRSLFYHQQLLQDKVPQSIGGGIGQSRLCMFLLKKRHIGEVQVSVWPESLRREYASNGIHLL